MRHVRGVAVAGLAAVLVLAIVVAAAGCTGVRPARAPAATSAPGVIPDGAYEKVVTAADAQALGVPLAVFRRGIGDADRATISFQVLGRRFFQMQTSTAAATPQLGDMGALSYPSPGRVRLSSESDLCPRCTGLFSWQVAGDQLTLRTIEHQTSDSPEEMALARLISEGTFTQRP